MDHLFDPDVVVHGDLSPMALGDDEFSYLSRSGKPEAERVRHLMERWWSEYPEDRRPGIAARIQAGDARSSAFFELLLYHLLCKLGASVEVEPAAQGRRTSFPDFRVTLPSGHAFWLEAVAVSHACDRQDWARQREQEIVDYLNERLVSPRCWWHVRIEAIGKVSPKLRCLKGAIETRMRSLPMDMVAEARADDGDMTPYEVHWEDGGWRVVAYPRPCRHPEICDGKRPIGSWSLSGEYVNTRERVRDAVRRKLRQHAGLTEAIVIAVNVVGPHAASDDIFEGLYGSETWCVPARPGDDVAPIYYRDTDGVWGGPVEPKSQRMIAVLAGARIGPCDWPRRTLTMYANPFADVPEGFDLPDLPKVTFNGTSFNTHEGRTLGEIMGFDQEWPECSRI